MEHVNSAPRPDGGGGGRAAAISHQLCTVSGSLCPAGQRGLRAIPVIKRCRRHVHATRTQRLPSCSGGLGSPCRPAAASPWKPAFGEGLESLSRFPVLLTSSGGLSLPSPFQLLTSLPNTSHNRAFISVNAPTAPPSCREPGPASGQRDPGQEGSSSEQPPQGKPEPHREPRGLVLFCF